MNADGESAFESHKRKFSRLAHERNDRFGGEFFRAKIIYKELLSAEGHRHYPLREPKCLRMTPDLMLPLGTVVLVVAEAAALAVDVVLYILVCVVLYQYLPYCETATPTRHLPYTCLSNHPHIALPSHS